MVLSILTGLTQLSGFFDTFFECTAVAIRTNCAPPAVVPAHQSFQRSARLDRAERVLRRASRHATIALHTVNAEQTSGPVLPLLQTHRVTCLDIPNVSSITSPKRTKLSRSARDQRRSLPKPQCFFFAILSMQILTQVLAILRLIRAISIAR